MLRLGADARRCILRTSPRAQVSTGGFGPGNLAQPAPTQQDGDGVRKDILEVVS